MILPNQPTLSCKWSGLLQRLVFQRLIVADYCIGLLGAAYIARLIAAVYIARLVLRGLLGAAYIARLIARLVKTHYAQASFICYTEKTA